MNNWLKGKDCIAGIQTGREEPENTAESRRIDGKEAAGEEVIRQTGRTEEDGR